MFGDDLGEAAGRRGATGTFTKNAPPRIRVQHAIKRALDCLVSILAIIALAPFFCAFAASAAVAGRRPFARTVHIGRGGKSIALFAFTTPTPPDALGMFLRESGLVHAPRLINVLRGDLALIGPHPRRWKEPGGPDAGMPMRPGLFSPNAAPRAPGERAARERAYVESYTLARDLRVIAAQIRGMGDP